MLSLRRIAAAAAFSFSLALAGEAFANACEPEIVRASDRYGVPVGILYAVGLAETGRQGSMEPNALNIKGKAIFPPSRAAAAAKVAEATAKGDRMVDVGCMQINMRWHAGAFRNVDEMLEPRRNVDYAARFLVELKQRHSTWTMAIARYHAGPGNDPAQQRYICRVIANLVATGFGSWTSEARAFCNQ